MTAIFDERTIINYYNYSRSTVKKQLVDNGGFQYDRNQTALTVNRTVQITKQRFTFSNFAH